MSPVSSILNSGFGKYLKLRFVNYKKTTRNRTSDEFVRSEITIFGTGITNPPFVRGFAVGRLVVLQTIPGLAKTSRPTRCRVETIEKNRPIVVSAFFFLVFLQSECFKRSS